MRLNKTQISNPPVSFPFVALAGHEAAKAALLLLAVEPRLRGALIGEGPGESVPDLIRGFARLLIASRPLSTGRGAMPFVEVPLHVAEENLLGGLDLGRALKAGERRVRPGLLTRADGGLLYVRDVNLLDEGAARRIACALDEGRVCLEREGLSAVLPADFIFLGSGDLSAEALYAGLLDRAGLRVEAGPPLAAEDHELMLDRALAFDHDPRGFAARFADETRLLVGTIGGARRRLAEVDLPRPLQHDLLGVARALGVVGHRADIFARHAARASAALAGRATVSEEDLLVAIRLTLLPRATRLPEAARQQAETGDSPAPREDAPQAAGDSRDQSAPADDERLVEELLIEAAETFVPPDWLPLASRNAAGASSGKRGKAASAARGRHRRSVTRRVSEGRIAIGPTLRAAAPHQIYRKARSRRAGGEEDRLVIRRDDLRFKEFKRRVGMLFVFAVDASGSMAVNRMAQAKGATARLLQQAYLHRDKVALVSFRGREARVLLPPTRSVELARRLVDAMPAGGATPLGAGLRRALELARLARLRDLSEAVVVTLTDGRANVPLREEPGQSREERQATLREELRQIGATYRREGVSAVVVDTRFHFFAGDEARELAEAVGGRYVYLPRADAESLKETVREFAARLRGRRRAGRA